MKIADFEIGRQTFIIAEFGANIFGGPSIKATLQRFCQLAHESGADAVKVQMYKHTHFPKPEWGEKSQTEFPRELFPEFCDRAHSLGMAAGASVFDDEAVAIVAEYGDFLKLATREANNEVLRNTCIKTGVPLIRSVDWRDISTNREPYHAVRISMRNNIATLGCVPIYPTPPRPEFLPFELNVNLDNPCGWSSHSQGFVDVLCAVKEGAVIIEKHFCTHPSDYEARWSLHPRDFAEMVWCIRAME